MKARTLGLLGVITLGVIIAAWQISEQRAPQTEVTRAPLFPGLVDRVNDVRQMNLISAEHETQLRHDDQRWIIVNKDGFPADAGKVRRAVLHIAGLRTVEPKTSSAERYARLGVSDLDDDEASGTLVELRGDDDAPLAALIVGNPRDGGARPQHYVRKPDDAQSWLVDGELEVDADPILWLDAQITDIDTERVREVRIEPAAGSPIVIRKAERGDNFFDLQQVPTGFEPKSRAMVSSAGAVLLDLRFNDVASATRVADAEPLRKTTLRTFDGLVVTWRDYELDGAIYTTFAFDFDAQGVVAAEPATDNAAEAGAEAGAAATDADGATETPSADPDKPPADSEPAQSVAEEADALTARTADWAYVLPAYKRRMIDREFEDLIQPVTEKAGDTDSTP
ncbi:MAG: DUF4340 domain-containing protein [Gammaproteobacteria bacterium]